MNGIGRLESDMAINTKYGKKIIQSQEEINTDYSMQSRKTISSEYEKNW